MRSTPADQTHLFEKLCLLRALYRRRGSRDAVAVMTVSETLRYAEELLARPQTASR